MTPGTDLLDKAKGLTGSDSETARRIGMRQQHISAVRQGKKKLSAYQAAAIAELLGERWTDVALPIMAEQAKTAKERRFWMGKLETLKRIAPQVALAFLLALILPLGAGQKDDALPYLTKESRPNHVYYVKYVTRRTVGIWTRLYQWFAQKKPPVSGAFLFMRRQSPVAVAWAWVREA